MQDKEELLAHLECSFSEGSVVPSPGAAHDYFSLAHPEVWGGGGLPSSSPLPPPPPPGHRSANATLLAPPDLDDLDLDHTLRAGPEDSPSPIPPLPLDAPPSLPLDSNSNQQRLPLAPLSPLSPPPLPPKPKVGGVRGPPPRPPSRQLHLLHHPPPFPSTTAGEDDPPHPPDHPPRHTHDKFNISFV